MSFEKLQPHLLCQKKDIAPYVLLPGDPNRVLRMAKLLDEFKEISYHREFRVVTGKYKNIPVTICSTGIGGPSTAIAMEELINLGAKIFIRVGSCGGNQPEIKIGDAIISEAVIREDHTSLDYLPIQFPALADREVVNALEESAKKLKIRYFVGPTLSVDALYSEKNKQLKDFWRKFGCLAQEMEAGTVFVLAKFRKVKAGAIFLVVNRINNENIKEGISRYAFEGKMKKGKLIEMEKKITKVALESIVLLSS
jgi:uridine phosphorylase